MQRFVLLAAPDIMIVAEKRPGTYLSSGFHKFLRIKIISSLKSLGGLEPVFEAKTCSSSWPTQASQRRTQFPELWNLWKSCQVIVDHRCSKFVEKYPWRPNGLTKNPSQLLPFANLFLHVAYVDLVWQRGRPHIVPTWKGPMRTPPTSRSIGSHSIASNLIPHSMKQMVNRSRNLHHFMWQMSNNIRSLSERPHKKKKFSEPVQKSELGGGAGADINAVIASSVSRNLALHQLVYWGQSIQMKLLAATGCHCQMARLIILKSPQLPPCLPPNKLKR